MFRKSNRNRVSGRRSQPATPAKFEGLESRELFAVTAGVVDGVLKITGTDSHDRITVSRDTQNNFRVQASTWMPSPGLPVSWSWQKTTRSVPSTGVTRVIVNAGKGNDRVTMKTGGAEPESYNPIDFNTIVRGGEGNDTLDATQAGWCLLDGGKGSDTFIGGLSTAVDYRSRTRNLFIDRRDIGNDGERGENDSISNSIQFLLLGSGNDTVISKGLNLTQNVRAFAGNDRLIGSAGCEILDGGADDDVIVGGTQLGCTLIGGDGDDLIDTRGGSAYVYGGTYAEPDLGFDMAWTDAGDFVNGIDLAL